MSKKLQSALDDIPELGIFPKKLSGEQTAHRWLLKLGWRRTLVYKGVYMDGHEHNVI